jgi:hypothetical protein
MRNKKEEKARAEKYIDGLMNSAEGAADAEPMVILTEKLLFWFISARFWSKEFQELSGEQYYVY